MQFHAHVEPELNSSLEEESSAEMVEDLYSCGQ